MMARKKGIDLDDQFEAFLKESLSDDESIDTARLEEFLQPKKKEAVPWWMKEDDGDLDLGTGGGKSFLKPKEKDPEPDYNLPKKDFNRKGKGENTTSNFASKNFKRETASSSKKDEARASMLSTGGADLNMTRDSLDEGAYGRETTKKYRPSEPTVDSSYEEETGDYSEPSESIGNKTPQMGMDTLEELAEKERFFKELERGAHATVDYSKLNRELEVSNTLRPPETMVGSQPDKDQEKESYDYSEDFEEKAESESEGKVSSEVTVKAQPDVPKPKPSMLSKVSLLDSLDSTVGISRLATQKRKKERDLREASDEEKDEDEVKSRTGDDSRGFTGTGVGITDTSREMEALHAAMRKVGMSTYDDSFNLGPTPGSQRTNQTLPDTDKPSRTVEDILREVEELQQSAQRGSESRGFQLEQASHLHTDKGEENAGFDLSPAPTGKGFDLSPVRKEAPGFDLSPVHKEAPGFDLSPVRKEAPGFDLSPVQKEAPGFDLSPVQKYAAGFDSSPDLKEAPCYLDQEDDSGLNLRPVTDGGKPLAPSVFDLLPTFNMNDLEERLAEVPPPSPPKAKKKSKTKYPSVRSSGYGRSTPQKSKSDTAWSPAKTMQLKVKGTEGGRKVGQAGPSVGDGQLLASVQSFASYIQDHFVGATEQPLPGEKWPKDAPVLSSSQRKDRLDGVGREQALIKEVQEWQEQWKEERRMHAKLKADMLSKEREFSVQLESQKLEHDQEIFKLKQENFILAAKMTENEVQSDIKKKVLDGKVIEGATQDQVLLMEKEIREQEKLLAGYQQENERLYTEMKRIQTMNKTTEDRMFKENQKLTNEVMSLRQQLERKEIELKHKGLITSPAVQSELAAGNVGATGAVLGAGQIAQLQAQLKQAKRKQEELERNVRVLEQTRKELEDHIEVLVKDRETFDERLDTARSNKSKEVVELQRRYEEEVERVSRKLKWYAENQDLLDRDSEEIKKKNLTIKNLQKRIEQLQSEAGQKQTDHRAKAKERAADARRIQDLERQVKEMEGIIKKRHPNSLPALIWAANSTTDTSPQKTTSVQFLEKQIKKLESELDTKDEEAKRDLRVMEQKYNAMKYQYEERIESLEEQLAKYYRPEDQKLKEYEHPHTHTLALQRELDSTRERYKKQITQLESQVENLLKELQKMHSKESVRATREQKAVEESQSELGMRVLALQAELLEKTSIIQQLTNTVERLEKEKQLQKTTELQGKGRGKQVKSKISTAGKTFKPKAETSVVNSKPEIPATALGGGGVYSESYNRDKQYQPNSFADLHISDVLKENQELKAKCERQELEWEQQRVELQKSVAQAEGIARLAREESDTYVAALKSSHQMELQKVLSENAMQHSASRLAELQSKLDTQEVIIKHLKKQVQDKFVDADQVSVLRIREAALEAQVQQLLQELQEAKKHHTPEMKHFEALQMKIMEVEKRHSQREQELKQIIQQTQLVASDEVQQENAKWKRIVQTKNHEIEKFRLELDNILQVLRELQRQGVVIPFSSS